MHVTGTVYIGNLCAGNIEPADEPASAEAYRDALVRAIIARWPSANVTWRIINASGYVGWGDQTHVSLVHDDPEAHIEAEEAREEEIEAEIEEIEEELFDLGEFWVLPEADTPQEGAHTAT